MGYCFSDLTMEIVLLKGKIKDNLTYFNSIQLVLKAKLDQMVLFATSAYISYMELYPLKP